MGNAFFGRRDWWIFAAAIALAAVCFFVFRGGTSGAEIRVYVGGELYETVRLGEERELEIIQADGSYNVVAVTKDGAYMREANCQNQNCLAQGELHLDNRVARPLGGWIICLPNRVSVELAGGEDDS